MNRSVIKELGDVSETLLVFGGPYSNLAATQAMQLRAGELGVAADQVICTGDLVAYCAEPVETLDLIMDWGIHVVMGNCEESLAFGEADCGCGFAPDSSCNTLAITWYRYAMQRVTPAQRRWMGNIPRGIDFTMANRRFRILHGSLNSINEFVFASSDFDNKRAQLQAAKVDAIVGGHCGLPFGQQVDAGYWLNAGVIGMPANNGGQHGWYMLVEPQGAHLEVSWHPLHYDYSISRASTIAAGMREYGDALGSGLWPNMDILPEPERALQGKTEQLPPMRF